MDKKSHYTIEAPESFFKVMRIVLLIVSLIFVNVSKIEAQEENRQKIKDKFETYSKLYMDVSDTTLQRDIKQGFIPIPIIITEPSLGGLGGGLAVTYLQSNRKSYRLKTPPTITGVFGVVTANSSWMIGAGHSQSWANDHIRYIGVLTKAKINMTFYTDGSSDGNSIPFNVKLNTWGTMQRISFRIGETNLFIGPQYLYNRTNNSLVVDTGNQDLDSLLNINGISSLGMLGAVVNWDSRDNVQSPDRGIYSGIITNYNSTVFGGDTEFWDVNFYYKHYFQVSENVYGAARFDTHFTEGDVPFYAKPYIFLRGVPAMRYQGNEVFVVETQWRWAFYKSWSVLGFTGTGKALDKISEFNSEPWIYNVGLGARYELVKLFGVRIGFDFAWSNEDFATYISVGSSF